MYQVLWKSYSRQKCFHCTSYTSQGSSSFRLLSAWHLGRRRSFRCWHRRDCPESRSTMTSTLTERSKIYFTYAQSLLTFRRGDTDTATKLEQKARRKYEEHNLYDQLQQLDLLRSLITAQPQATVCHSLLSVLFLVLLSVSILLVILQ